VLSPLRKAVRVRIFNHGVCILLPDEVHGHDEVTTLGGTRLQGGF
jgi:hypothetical protein